MKHDLNSLWQLISINYKEFIREPGILFWALIFPVLMAWVLGIAFSKKAELIQNVAYVNNSAHTNSRLAEFLVSSDVVFHKVNPGKEYRKSFDTKMGRLSFRLIPVTMDSAVLMLKRGQVSIILQDKEDSLYYLFDPQSADARFNYIMLSSAINHERIIYDTTSVKTLSQQGTRYVDFLIPGLLAMGIMNDFLWGIGYGLIEIRTKKLLRRMVAAPMKKSLFIFSHFFARMTLALFEAAVLLLFSWIYFRTQIQGSIVALILIFLAGSFCFAGISILTASRTSSSRIGNSLINLISMPMVILSGIFFSYHNFPDFIIPVIQKLPLTMLADSIRSIMIEGTGLVENMPEFLFLSGLGSICFLVGIRIYKWY
jgi:ABC-type multidrug transport system permease subunit